MLRVADKIMTRILEKTELRLGEKLFLKGDRCLGPKCAAVRRAYPPGVHGKKRGRGGRGGPSEFAALMREKQKVLFFYGIDNGAVQRYVEKASRKEGLFSDIFLRMMESRLDTVVWRAGLAPSRRSARQAVVHGRMLVNGKSVRSPGYETRIGDIVSPKARTGENGLYADTAERLAHHTPPKWITLDRERHTGTVSAAPEPDQIGVTFNITKMREFYSR